MLFNASKYSFISCGVIQELSVSSFIKSIKVSSSNISEAFDKIDIKSIVLFLKVCYKILYWYVCLYWFVVNSK